MGSEFPPVIIDSSGICDESMFEQKALGSMVVRSFDFAGGAEGTATVTASIASLYLIRDNCLIHKGDYAPNEIELKYGAGSEQAMAAGSSEVHAAGQGAEVAEGAAGARTITHPRKQVHTIRVPGEATPLEFGRDFHNFILILRRTAEG